MVLLRVGLVAGLAACQAHAPGVGRNDQAAAAAAAEGAYHRPPAIMAVSARGGIVTMVGQAMARSRVRLASPGGAAVLARADDSGRWRMAVPRAPRVRLFGLSMLDAGRTIQSEGYVAVPPSGPPAQLRAGAGALVFAPDPPSAGLYAVDYDRKGGAVVSGLAPRDTPVTLSVDGAPRVRAKSDALGRFSVALDVDEPLSPGTHQLSVAAAGTKMAASIDITAAPALAGPFAAEPARDGWRIDWMTPGGGVQTTILLAPGEFAR